MTVVGLRMTTAGGHHTTASTVRQFTDCLAAYFNGWGKLSRDLSWEFIYLQHEICRPMNDWQRCDVVDSNNVGEIESREIAAFWKEEVRQYQVSISYIDFCGYAAHRSEEEPLKYENKLGRERGSSDFW
ncbi:retrotransposon hot spot (RHS) protein [Trypanosoma cruzi]|nr:retrotransposon hot spot (RHS) protein [Trypanosoma cruzi]